jgi:hypothetical protein
MARRGGVTSKPAGRARGMAHDLTWLTVRREGEFRLGAKSEEEVLNGQTAMAQCDKIAGSVEKLGELRFGLV